MKVWYNVSMSKIDLAYTAGIIDGEGCIRIGQRRLHSNYIGVGVGSTSEWLINWLQFKYGGSVYSKKPWLANQKPQWGWDLRTRQAGDFLRMILPYLKLKRPQAELALAFQSRRRYRGHQPMSAEDIALDDADKILMHKYNKRGID